MPLSAVRMTTLTAFCKNYAVRFPDKSKETTSVRRKVPFLSYCQRDRPVNGPYHRAIFKGNEHAGRQSNTILNTISNFSRLSSICNCVRQFLLQIMIAKAVMKVGASLFSVPHQKVLIAILLLMTVHLLIQIVGFEWV